MKHKSDYKLMKYNMKFSEFVHEKSIIIYNACLDGDGDFSFDNFDNLIVKYDSSLKEQNGLENLGSLYRDAIADFLDIEENIALIERYATLEML